MIRRLEIIRRSRFKNHCRVACEPPSKHLWVLHPVLVSVLCEVLFFVCLFVLYL